MTNKVYDIITKRIIKQLESGTVPWHKPWAGGALPTNAVSKKPYKGINTLMLWDQYSNPYWVTYKQAQALGGNVKKGEKSTPIIYWMMRKSTTKTDKTTGEKVTHTKEYDRPILRYFNVFNVQQCEGLPDDLTTIDNQCTFNPIEAADTVINEYPDKPIIEHNGQRACYIPSRDVVNMPVKESFESTESYYSVLFHELVHSTGHESRLNRLSKNASFGNEEYSKEELIAELGASFLRAETGINADTKMEQSAAYIQSWIKALKDDVKLIIQASSKAQKATDLILNRMVA